MKINFHHEPNLKSPVMGKGYTDHLSVNEATIHCDLTDSETVQHEIAHVLAWRRPWVRLATRFGNIMLLLIYGWIVVVIALGLLRLTGWIMPEIGLGLLYALGMIGASGFVIPKLWLEKELESEMEGAKKIMQKVRNELWTATQMPNAKPIEFVQNSLCRIA